MNINFRLRRGATGQGKIESTTKTAITERGSSAESNSIANVSALNGDIEITERCRWSGDHDVTDGATLKHGNGKNVRSIQFHQIAELYSISPGGAIEDF